MMTSSYRPKAGRFLVSEPFLWDPNFKRTVILLVEHSEEGSIGFVLNRRLRVTVNELVEGLPLFKAPVFMGGPVERNTLHFVHKLGADVPGSREILNGLYWGGDFEQLKELIRLGKVDKREILFFVGYSGWENQQLAEELEKKSWIVAPHGEEFIFRHTYKGLWRAVLKNMGDKFEVISNYPPDPRLN